MYGLGYVEQVTALEMLLTHAMTWDHKWDVYFLGFSRRATNTKFLFSNFRWTNVLER